MSRFLVDLRVGPRDHRTAAELAASVALCTVGRGGPPPLLLVDEHLPYRSAILQVFGVVRHGRRKNGRGRRKKPRLKAPPGLLVGVVRKLRDAAGRLLGVSTRGLFGSRKAVRERVAELGVGQEVNTSHVERLNGTLRGQQARLGRRTRSVSRREPALQWSLWLWRDLYNWARPHRSLQGRTPAMAQGLADHVWSVGEYVRHAVHVGQFTRDVWADEREEALTSAVDRQKKRKRLPTS